MKVFVSRFRAGPVIDMTPDGQFAGMRPTRTADRVLGAAIIAAVIFGALALAALVLWVALALIPIALGAAVVAWGAWRFRLWRRGGSLFGGERHPTGG